jgi:hypothetical protein
MIQTIKNINPKKHLYCKAVRNTLESVCGTQQHKYPFEEETDRKS